MAQHQQWIKLDDAIYAYISESEQSINKFYKLWHIAFEGMTEMGLDFFYTVRSVKLPINANLTVNLPADYLNYTKIGVFNDRSEIIPLNYNSNLTLFQDLQATRQQSTEDPTLLTFYAQDSYIYYNFWNGNYFEQLYGLPSGAPFIGSYRIDNENGLIVLSEGFGYPYIALEYIASPKEGGDYYIPIQFKRAMIAYLSWRDIASLPSSRRGNLGDKRDRRHDYFNERRLAIARYDPIDLQAAYEWSLRNQRLVVKA